MSPSFISVIQERALIGREKMVAKTRVKRSASCHAFSFYGGDLLGRMGAAWFVSYIYFKRVNNCHVSWREIGTAQTRIKWYERSMSYHRYWLDKIFSMDEKRLETNTLGLTAIQIKNMAIKVMSAEW